MTIVARSLVAALFSMMVVNVAQAQLAALGDVSASSDAEHFGALRLRAGAMLSYRSPFDYAGIAAQTTQYTQSGWQSDAPAVLVLWRRQRRDTLAGTIAEGGVVRVSGRTRLIGDATWSLRPTERTGVELLLAGDLVETRRALERATAYTFASASVESQLGARFSAIGLVGGQRFTDGNARLHLRARLVWMLVPQQGISAQLRWRQYDSKQTDVNDAYFNPARYRQWDAGLALRKRYRGWVWSGTLAAGRETIDRATEHGTAIAELRTEGTLRKDIHVVLHASYNRAAGFVAANGYWYRVAGVTVIVPF